MDGSALYKVSNTWDSFWEKAGAVIVGGITAALAILIPGVGIIAGVALTVAAGLATSVYLKYNLPNTFYLPVFVLSPEEMFKNQIAALDVNFFSPNDYSDAFGDTETGPDQDIEQGESSASILQSTIGSWYLALRNFAIVALLSVLLYIGIRILASTTSQDRAKYKERLFSWVVALGILFFMHYIMAFATTVVEAVTEGINRTDNGILTPIPFKEDDDTYEFIFEQNDKTERKNAKEYFEEAGLVQEVNGQKLYLWPTNLMGKVRIDMQLETNENKDNQLLNKVGYTILYMVFVFYTIAFLFVYLKRLIMLAFLTMIAPLVAMTYPIDKVNDGNAQAFNMWLKEYIFNLLIQPLHLILYTMLVSSAIELAQTNMIYSIVALGFIFQADKILRKFFGFEKASTLASGSALGGAVAMWGISQISKISKLGSSKKPANADKAGQSKIYQRKADKGSKVSDLMDQQYGGSALPAGGFPTEDSNTIAPNVRAVGSADIAPGTEAYYRNQNIRRDELRAQGLNEEQVNAMAPLPRLNRTVQASPIISGTNATNNISSSTPYNSGLAYETLNRGRQYKTRKELPPQLKGAAATLGAGAKYVAPKAARLALKTALAAGAASIGVAGGLATADDMNILKYGAAGGMAGWALGSGASNIASRINESGDNVIEAAKGTYTTAAYGEDAEKQRQKDRADRLAMMDKDRRKKYAEEFGLKNKRAIDEVMDASQIFRKSGITDDDIIIKAMKADGFGDDKASRERVILAGLASETGNDVEKIEKIEKRLQEKGAPASDARKYTDTIRGFYNKT